MPAKRMDIQRAQRNFLRDAVYFLYENNRMAEAAKWFDYLGREISQQDPSSTVIPIPFPRNLTLDEYAVARVQEDVGDTSQERTTAAFRDCWPGPIIELAIGQDDRYAGYKLLAEKFMTVTRPKLPT